MRRSHLTIYAFILLGFLLDFRPAGAQAIGVAVNDFSYLDTSGEPTDQTALHERRLQAFMTALRRDVETDRRLQLVSSAQADPKLRIVGGIHKMSTLVQWAKVAVIDVGTDRVLLKKLYTFRGDNDEAWDRAEAFISREILAALAGVATAPPIALAVFDFELEDTTAAAPASGIAASDAAQLADVTDGVRQLFAQSGRYRVIDVSAASADAAKSHGLRDCGGCEAAIASKLGADQALIGVVRRVSRTEYTIGFQIRDSRTGAVVARGDSGLRMGADYAWRRGAVRLISDRLLASQSQQ
jgi:hypothetical protein